MVLSLKFATDSKYWIREKTVEYLPKPELVGGENKPPVITGEEPQRKAPETKRPMRQEDAKKMSEKGATKR